MSATCVGCKRAAVQQFRLADIGAALVPWCDSASCAQSHATAYFAPESAMGRQYATSGGRRVVLSDGITALIAVPLALIGPKRGAPEDESSRKRRIDDDVQMLLRAPMDGWEAAKDSGDEAAAKFKRAMRDPETMRAFVAAHYHGDSAAAMADIAYYADNRNFSTVRAIASGFPADVLFDLVGENPDVYEDHLREIDHKDLVWFLHYAPQMFVSIDGTTPGRELWRDDADKLLWRALKKDYRDVLAFVFDKFGENVSLDSYDGAVFANRDKIKTLRVWAWLTKHYPTAARRLVNSQTYYRSG
jgi:hypothetical protein